MLFVYTMTALTHIRLRWMRENASRPEPAAQMWLFSWTSYLAIAGMTAVLAAMAFTPSLSRDFWFSITTLAVAGIAYRVRVRVGKKHVLK